MATVNVTSFDQFVSAVAVSGDTVVLPEGAIWNLNDIYPEGYVGDIPVNCATINGRGTEIRNLHHYGKFIVPNDLEINELHMKNTVCEDTAFWGREGAINSRRIMMNQCIMTGIFGINTTNFCESFLTLNRCTINLDMTQGGYGDVSLSEAGTDADYCRISMQYPNNFGGTFSTGGLWRYCLVNVRYLGCRVFYSGQLSGCVVLGNFGTAYDGSSSSSGSQVSIYDVAAFDSEFEPGSAYFKGVTYDQLYDAAYLASIGFPIGA